MDEGAPDTTVVDPVQARAGTPGLGKRLSARVLDAIVVGIPASLLLAIMGLPAPTLGLGGTEAWVESAITAGVWFAYYAGFEAVTGATIAKRILGMEVVSRTEDSAGLGGAAVRNSWILFGLVPVVGGLILLVAVILIAVSIGRGDDHVGIHDRLAGTTVVSSA